MLLLSFWANWDKLWKRRMDNVPRNFWCNILSSLFACSISASGDFYGQASSESTTLDSSSFVLSPGFPLKASESFKGKLWMPDLVSLEWAGPGSGCSNSSLCDPGCSEQWEPCCLMRGPDGTGGEFPRLWAELCWPKIHMVKSWPPVPQNVTIFGDKCFKDVS